MRRPSLFVYNGDNYRAAGELARELIAAAAELRPRRIVVVEAIGNELPELRGYWLLHDKSRPGRENLAVYVRKVAGRRRPRVRWIDLAQTWTKTNPGAHGQHWPRSIMVVAGMVQLIVWHAPPKGTDNTLKAQQEGLDAIVRLVEPWERAGAGMVWPLVRVKAAQLRPRVIAGDWNRAPAEDGPGPGRLIRLYGFTAAGAGIDLALVRGGVRIASWRYVEAVNGVPLRSDHRRALVATLSLWKRFAW